MESQYQHITAQEAKTLLASGDVKTIDIRDVNSYNAGHIEGAVHLTNDSIQHFLANTDKSTPLIVYCYHGNTSQQAAQFFVQNGFTAVYTLDGGYEAWQQA